MIVTRMPAVPWLALGIFSSGLAQAATAPLRETVVHSFPEVAPQGANPMGSLIGDAEGNLYGTASKGGKADSGIVFKVDAAGNQTVLYSFKGGVADGANPSGALVRDHAGNLYGATEFGGANGWGTLYKLAADGRETVLYSFAGGADGAMPSGGVIRDTSGNLYGVTNSGGLRAAQAGYGVVYRLDPNNRLNVLYTFKGSDDGCSPSGAALIRDSDGNLYGTASSCGANGRGVVFELDQMGHQTVLYSFSGGADGGSPNGTLVRDPNGNLYGVASGGSNFGGVVYKLDTSHHQSALYSFTNGSDGGGPVGGVVRDASGNLYGATSFGGQYFAGVVFKIDPAGNESLLYSFTGKSDGGTPYTGLVRAFNGNLYGTTFYGGLANQGVVHTLDTNNVETVLCGFSSPANDGGDPLSGLIRDSVGNLYGTTNAAGTGHVGTVYKIDPAGKETVLYNFTGGSDGGGPVAGVIADNNDLYGTAVSGGSGNAGVVYKLDAAGNQTVIYNFEWYGSVGAFPWGGVIRGEAGTLYGTAAFAGANYNGVVYKVDSTTGVQTVLYAFTGGADGGTPWAGLTRDASGNLYGTTSGGGASGLGVVYKISPAGQETVLHSFAGGTDGASPFFGVVVDKAGDLYGTTATAGASNYGVVFKLDQAGNETLLHTFTGRADGGAPNGLIIDSAGNLYGTTNGGGAHGKGVVFQLDRSGKETVLHDFSGPDGASPYFPALLRDSDGHLFGTTPIGGAQGGGLVFRIDPN